MRANATRRVDENAPSDHRDPRRRSPARRRDADGRGEGDRRGRVSRRHRKIARVGPSVQEIPVPRLTGRDERARAAREPLHDAADRARDGDRFRGAQAERAKPARASARGRQARARGEPDDPGSAPPVERRSDRVQCRILLERGSSATRPRSRGPHRTPGCSCGRIIAARSSRSSPDRARPGPASRPCARRRGSPRRRSRGRSLMPTESWCGFSNVALSAIVAGSNTRMSAFIPSLRRPRSAIESRVATAEVALRTASSSVITCSSRTYLPSRRVKFP